MARKSEDQKKRQKSGKEGENLARKVLRQRGVRMVEKIGTPVRLIPYATSKPGIYRVIFGEKVSGDMVGILDDGTRVLTETKSIEGNALHWSKLRAHQPERLDLNKQYNGISLLVWVSDYGVFVMDWNFPNEDFGPGKGLRYGRAQILDIMDVTILSKK